VVRRGNQQDGRILRGGGGEKKIHQGKTDLVEDFKGKYKNYK